MIIKIIIIAMVQTGTATILKRNEKYLPVYVIERVCLKSKLFVDYLSKYSSL